MPCTTRSLTDAQITAGYGRCRCRSPGTTRSRPASRSTSRAIASRSAVDTPGRGRRASSPRSAAGDDQPGLRASIAIWSGDLSSMRSGSRNMRRGSGVGERGERGDRPLGDVLDRAERVDRDQLLAARGRTRSAARSARRRPRGGAGRSPGGRRRAGTARRRTCRRRPSTLGGSYSMCQTCPHFLQVRRPDSRRTTSSWSTSRSSTTSSVGAEVVEDAVELVGLRRRCAGSRRAGSRRRRRARRAGRAPSRW